jgi:rhamnogalacturonan endolyase
MVRLRHHPALDRRRLPGPGASSTNFVSRRHGDTVRELLNGTHIDKYGRSNDTRPLTGSGVHSNNGTKANRLHP